MSKVKIRKEKRKGSFKWQFRDSLIVGVIVLFILSWLAGKQYFTAHIDPFFKKAWPEADTYKNLTENHAEIFDSEDVLIGYMAKGYGEGYGGPLTTAVAVDTLGNVKSLAVIEYRETPSFFQKVLNNGVLRKLVLRSVHDSIAATDVVDGITGATFTFRAISDSVDEAVNIVATDSFKIKRTPKKAAIIFGLPEIILIALFLVAVVRRKFVKGKNTNRIRWFTLIIGLVFLGFVYNRSFVLADINMVLMGYFPNWRVHLYWYILIAGLLLFKSKKNWNTYCYDFCPFGACQEVLAQIGGAKNRSVRWPKTLLWLQRTLAIAAVSMALIFRNPAFSSFEIFGTMFDLNGSSYQFATLAIILLVSLFMYRPWCNYLCPLHKRTLEGLFDRVRKYIKIGAQTTGLKWKKN